MSSPTPVLEPAGPASVFAALGDAVRLELLARLNDGRARSISQLTTGLGLTRQGVTKHLGVLERAGIVSSRRVGRENRFVYRDEPIRDATSYLDAVSAQWDEALARLKAYLGE